MNVYFYVDKEIDQNYYSFGYEPDDVIITTFSEVFNELKGRFNCRIYNMDLGSIAIQDDAIAETKDYVSHLMNTYSELEISPFINYIFSHYFLLAFNLVNFIDNKLKDESIDEIYLFGGNRKVKYTGLFLGEGEKAFNLLYKRSWFINNIIYELFSGKCKITWKKEDNAVKLRLFKFARTKLISASKVATIIYRTLAAKLDSKGIGIEALNTGKDKVLLLVRNPVQVEPMQRLYYIVNEQSAHEAVFIKYGMLQKNNLDYILSKNALRYVDLISIMDFKEIAKQLLRSFKSSGVKNVKEYSAKYKDSEFNVYNKEILEEIKTCWFENNYRLYLVDKLIAKMKDSVKIVYTTETYNHNAAIEGLWAKREGIRIYSIQHVGMERFKIPVDIWTDSFYYMDYELFKYKSEYMEDSSKCKYIGPISYDSIFNTSESTNTMQRVTILTQPDDFRFDFIEMLDDIVSIRKDNNLSFDIFIKMHPRDQYYDLYHDYEKREPFIKLIDRAESTNDLIKNSDIIFSVTSGTIFQSILIGTPAVCVNYRKKYNIDIIDYLSDDVTAKAFSKDDIRDAILGYSDLRSKFIRNRGKYLERYIPLYNGDAAATLLKEHGIINDVK